MSSGESLGWSGVGSSREEISSGGTRGVSEKFSGGNFLGGGQGFIQAHGGEYSNIAESVRQLVGA